MTVLELLQLSVISHLLPSAIYAICCWLIWRNGWHLTYSLLVLPGVFLHELTHLLASILCNGKPVGISFIPRRTQNGWVLGSVTSSNVRWYNAWIIGLAPISLCAAPWVFLNYMATNRGELTTSYEIIFAPVIGPIILSFWPSRTDWRIAGRSLPLALIVLLITMML